MLSLHTMYVFWQHRSQILFLLFDFLYRCKMLMNISVSTKQNLVKRNVGLKFIAKYTYLLEVYLPRVIHDSFIMNVSFHARRVKVELISFGEEKQISPLYFLFALLTTQTHVHTSLKMFVHKT